LSELATRKRNGIFEFTPEPNRLRLYEEAIFKWWKYISNIRGSQRKTMAM